MNDRISITEITASTEPTKYVAIKMGSSGDKTHIGIVKGERKNRFGRMEMVIWKMCGTSNTKNINRNLALTPLREGTPISCSKCLAKLERMHAEGRGLNLVAKI